MEYDLDGMQNASGIFFPRHFAFHPNQQDNINP